MLPRREPMVYSRAEWISDAVVHVVGVVSAVVAAPVLVTLAWVWVGDTSAVAASIVYCLALIAMLVCSAIYNMAPFPARKDVFRRLDQSAIYMKIAGTYTPFAVLTGTHAGLFFAGIWSAAIAGASMIALGPRSVRRKSYILYLLIGWAGLIWGGPMLANLSGTGFVLIVVGGSVYTMGVLFLLWERLPFHNTIWHVFVLAATAVFYAAVLVEVLARTKTG